MKKTFLYIAALAIAFTLGRQTAHAQESHGSSVPRIGGPESIGAKKIAMFEYKPIDWQVPEVGKDIERYVTKNGMVVYLKEDHKLPEFRIRAMIRCGEVYEAAEKAGISDLAGTVLRTGGTTSLSPDSLNALLEYIAASVETNVSVESGSASLYCLSKDIETGVKIFADVLRNPAFNAEKLDLAKEQIRKAIKSRNDNPGAIMAREFDRCMYGEHPYGRVREWATVKPLTRDDLIAYHKQYFVPNNIMIGVTGDFDRGKIKKLLDKYLGDWKTGNAQVPAPPKVAAEYKPGVYMIEKDVNQSNIRIGHLGITQDNPDRYAISVMNFILGGGSFTSRMTSRVRSDEGLAYSVGTAYDVSSRDLGTFFAYCQTKSATTLKAINLMKAEIERIRDGHVTDDELALAKDSYINRYVFQFTSADQIVGQMMSLEYFDRPRDLLKVYLDNIRSVTKDDVLRVAKGYLHPDKLSFVVVGKPATFDGDLSTLGPVTEIALQEPIVN